MAMIMLKEIATNCYETTPWCRERKRGMKRHHSVDTAGTAKHVPTIFEFSTPKLMLKIIRDSCKMVDEEGGDKHYVYKPKNGVPFYPIPPYFMRSRSLDGRRSRKRQHQVYCRIYKSIWRSEWAWMQEKKKLEADKKDFERFVAPIIKRNMKWTIWDNRKVDIEEQRALFRWKELQLKSEEIRRKVVTGTPKWMTKDKNMSFATSAEKLLYPELQGHGKYTARIFKYIDPPKAWKFLQPRIEDQAKQRANQLIVAAKQKALTEFSQQMAYMMQENSQLEAEERAQQVDPNAMEIDDSSQPGPSRNRINEPEISLIVTTVPINQPRRGRSTERRSGTRAPPNTEEGSAQEEETTDATAQENQEQVETQASTSRDPAENEHLESRNQERDNEVTLEDVAAAITASRQRLAEQDSQPTGQLEIQSAPEDGQPAPQRKKCLKDRIAESFGDKTMIEAPPNIAALILDEEVKYILYKQVIKPFQEMEAQIEERRFAMITALQAIRDREAAEGHQSTTALENQPAPMENEQQQQPSTSANIEGQQSNQEQPTEEEQRAEEMRILTEFLRSVQTEVDWFLGGSVDARDLGRDLLMDENVPEQPPQLRRRQRRLLQVQPAEDEEEVDEEQEQEELPTGCARSAGIRKAPYIEPLPPSINLNPPSSSNPATVAVPDPEQVKKDKSKEFFSMVSADEYRKYLFEERQWEYTRFLKIWSKYISHWMKIRKMQIEEPLSWEWPRPVEMYTQEVLNRINVLKNVIWTAFPGHALTVLKAHIDPRFLENVWDRMQNQRDQNRNRTGDLRTYRMKTPYDGMEDGVPKIAATKEMRVSTCRKVTSLLVKDLAVNEEEPNWDTIWFENTTFRQDETFHGRSNSPFQDSSEYGTRFSIDENPSEISLGQPTVSADTSVVVQISQEIEQENRNPRKAPLESLNYWRSRFTGVFKENMENFASQTQRLKGTRASILREPLPLISLCPPSARTVPHRLTFINGPPSAAPAELAGQMEADNVVEQEVNQVQTEDTIQLQTRKKAQVPKTVQREDPTKSAAARLLKQKDPTITPTTELIAKTAGKVTVTFNSSDVPPVYSKKRGRPKKSQEDDSPEKEDHPLTGPKQTPGPSEMPSTSGLTSSATSSLSSLFTAATKTTLPPQPLTSQGIALPSAANRQGGTTPIKRKPPLGITETGQPAKKQTKKESPQSSSSTVVPRNQEAQYSEIPASNQSVSTPVLLPVRTIEVIQPIGQQSVHKKAPKEQRTKLPQAQTPIPNLTISQVQKKQNVQKSELTRSTVRKISASEVLVVAETPRSARLVTAQLSPYSDGQPPSISNQTMELFLENMRQLAQQDELRAPTSVSSLSPSMPAPEQHLEGRTGSARGSSVDSEQDFGILLEAMDQRTKETEWKGRRIDKKKKQRSQQPYIVRPPQPLVVTLDDDTCTDLSPPAAALSDTPVGTSNKSSASSRSEELLEQDDNQQHRFQRNMTRLGYKFQVDKPLNIPDVQLRPPEPLFFPHLMTSVEHEEPVTEPISSFEQQAEAIYPMEQTPGSDKHRPMHDPTNLPAQDNFQDSKLVTKKVRTRKSQAQLLSEQACTETPSQSESENKRRVLRGRKSKKDSHKAKREEEAAKQFAANQLAAQILSAGALKEAQIKSQNEQIWNENRVQRAIEKAAEDAKQLQRPQQYQRLRDQQERQQQQQQQNSAATSLTKKSRAQKQSPAAETQPAQNQFLPILISPVEPPESQRPATETKVEVTQSPSPQLQPLLQPAMISPVIKAKPQKPVPCIQEATKPVSHRTIITSPKIQKIEDQPASVVEPDVRSDSTSIKKAKAQKSTVHAIDDIPGTSARAMIAGPSFQATVMQTLALTTQASTSLTVPERIPQPHDVLTINTFTNPSQCSSVISTNLDENLSEVSNTSYYANYSSIHTEHYHFAPKKLLMIRAKQSEAMQQQETESVNEVQVIIPPPPTMPLSPDIVIIEQPEKTPQEIKEEALEELDRVEKPQIEIKDAEYDVEDQEPLSQGSALIMACDYAVFDEEEISQDMTPYAPESVRVDSEVFYVLMENLVIKKTKFSVLPKMSDQFKPLPENLMDYMTSSFSVTYLRDNLRIMAYEDPENLFNHALGTTSKTVMELLTRSNDPIQRKKQLVTSHKIKELMGLFLKYKKERLHDLAMEALGSTSGEDYEALKHNFNLAMDRVQIAICDMLMGLCEESKGWEPTINNLRRRFEAFLFGWRSFILHGYPLKVFLSLYQSLCESRVIGVLEMWLMRLNKLNDEICKLMKKEAKERVKELVDRSVNVTSYDKKINGRDTLWQLSLLDVQPRKNETALLWM